jgi:hypothetical protein
MTWFAKRWEAGMNGRRIEFNAWRFLKCDVRCSICRHPKHYIGERPISGSSLRIVIKWGS